MPVKTYFISGFLGAGKTTLLNNLLEELSDKKTGVIMNEFGEVNIDANLIEYKKGMEVLEINNGSIFCTCLSGSFVKRIVELSKLDLDYLLVESSGMARPASVGAILEQVEKLKEELLDYQGMITIVDASTYLKLVKSVNAVQEQVIYSDLVVINKKDLVEDSTIEEVERNIQNLNPGVKIIRTEYAKIDGILKENFYNVSYENRKPLNKCSTDNEGVFKTLIEVENKVTKKNLVCFLEELLPYTFRIKGFVQTETGIFHIDCVPNRIKINEVEYSRFKFDKSKLVVISQNKEIDKLAKKVKQEEI